MPTPDSSGSLPLRIEREVGSTPAEFARALRLAQPQGVEEVGPGRFQVRADPVLLEIAISEGPPRRIGLFVIPVLHAVYDFRHGSRTDSEALLRKLDRAMQRGGG